MNVFGIQLTPGHLIVAGVLVVLYDAIWTWVFDNEKSDWWFERLQGYLKVGIYLGVIALIMLIAFTPWPINFVLAVSVVLSIYFISIWKRRRRS